MVIWRERNWEKSSGKASLFIIYLLVPFAFFSKVYIFQKYYLWAMEFCSILFSFFHVSVSFKIQKIGAPVWLVLSQEHANLHLRVASSSLVLGVEIS